MAECRQLGNEMVGHKLRVWWPGAESYYLGTVQAFNPHSCRHNVKYQDGDIEDLWLAVESYEDLGEP